ncbi:MAG: dephospho-CoA kinase [Piscirickettsiaceae bacterium]|nr:dephospho-CoA kinase [Piscirickettsiaceae bacterium]
MLKIGLTGGIASGKSAVCQLFSQYDIPIIDADIIARQLVEPGLPAFKEIVLTFGSNIVQQDGYLNRSLLRQLIFTDSAAKKQLETILHPKIRQQLSSQSQQYSSQYCILVIPLLIEADMQDLVDRILVIDLSPEQQLQRLCQRDQLSPDDAQMIINNQCARHQRLSIADDIIDNNNTPEILAQSVTKLHQKYLNLAE